MNNKIIEKVKKLFALANNNPSEEEAILAALKAQELMAKHNITNSDIEDELTKGDEKIFTAQYETGAGLKWKFPLATVIAKNFRCKTFSYGARTIAFYGHETDAKIAKEVFEFLFTTGHKLANKEVYRKTKEYGTATGVYNSFCQGFIAGIQQELEKQCVALMIITPQKVEDEYKEFIKGAKTRNQGRLTNANTFDYEAYTNGETEGKNIMRKKTLSDGLA